MTDTVLYFFLGMGLSATAATLAVMILLLIFGGR